MPLLTGHRLHVIVGFYLGYARIIHIFQPGTLLKQFNFLRYVLQVRLKSRLQAVDFCFVNKQNILQVRRPEAASLGEL